MHQLLLELFPPPPPSLDNFVCGRNAETLAALSEWLAGEREETGFCVFGEIGCGRTHLLLASGFSYMNAQLNPSLEGLSEQEQLAIDDVNLLNAHGQIALFNHFNRLKMSGGRLLTAASQPPQHLALREDLRTRLGSGLIYRVLPLSDTEKAEALATQARERALKLSPDAIDYLLRHAPRDMRTLSSFVVALDRYTLEHKRAVTLPLLRELLTQETA